MKAVAIESSTEILSLCGRSGDLFFEVTRDVDLRHAEQILPLVDLVLKNLGISAGDLDLVVAARGPGSFTGLRIGMAAAKGLCAAAGCPCVSVPTLDVYGSLVPPGTGTVTAAVVDAKKNRFYAALYRDGERLTDYLDAEPGEIARLAAAHPRVVLTGPHAGLFLERLGAAGTAGNFLRDPDCRAGRSAVLLRMGMEAFEAGLRDDPSAGPLYVRPPEARPSDGGA